LRAARSAASRVAIRDRAEPTYLFDIICFCDCDHQKVAEALTRPRSGSGVKVFTETERVRRREYVHDLRLASQQGQSLEEFNTERDRLCKAGIE
jgi:hypothetical protein